VNRLARVGVNPPNFRDVLSCSDRHPKQPEHARIPDRAKHVLGRGAVFYLDRYNTTGIAIVIRPAVVLRLDFTLEPADQWMSEVADGIRVSATIFTRRVKRTNGDIQAWSIGCHVAERVCRALPNAPFGTDEIRAEELDERLMYRALNIFAVPSGSRRFYPRTARTDVPFHRAPARSISRSLSLLSRRQENVFQKIKCIIEGFVIRVTYVLCMRINPKFVNGIQRG
jgi:hypothetical protein